MLASSRPSLRVLGTSFEKKPFWNPVNSERSTLAAPSWSAGTATSSDRPIRSQTSGVVERVRLRRVFSAMNSWRSISSASVRFS